MLFFLFTKKMYYSFHWNIKQHNFSTLSQYDKFLKHKIKMKMISEGPRDTEDWSNDAEHVPLPLQKYNTFVNILKTEYNYLGEQTSFKNFKTIPTMDIYYML